MALLIKNQSQLLNETLTRLQEAGDVTDLSPARSAYIMSQISAEHVAEIYRSLDVNTAQAYITTARGPYLDLIGDLFQIRRQPAQPSVALASDRTIRFYVTTGTLSGIIPTKIIPANTVISTANSRVSFRTSRDTLFSDVATEIFVDAVSTDTGSDQRVGINELTTHNLGLSTLLVTNTASITNSTDVEDDEQLRARLSNAMLTRVTGNTEALREAGILAGGVSEVSLVSAANGPGTVELTVIPVANQLSSATLAQVQANIELVRSAGTVVDVKQPSFIPVEITVVLRFRSDAPEGEKETIRLSAVQAILEYLSILRIGQPFIINEMIQRVMDVDERVLDMEIRCFAFRRRAQVLRNFIADPDELFIPDPELEQPIRVL